MITEIEKMASKKAKIQSNFNFPWFLNYDYKIFTREKNKNFFGENDGCTTLNREL